jgi:hypothetical protein
MRTKIVIATGALSLAGLLPACASGSGHAAPAVTKTITVSPKASVKPPTQTTAPATTAPASAAPRPTPTPAPVPSASSPAGIQAVTPWAVVSEYYGDIESGDYADAYALLSSGSVTGQTYQQFVNGFACTSYDNLSELGTAGDTVTISLDATQCDGTVNQYQGTYTVQNGLITGADVTQTG